jgi:hypothetical protein
LRRFRSAASRQTATGARLTMVPGSMHIKVYGINGN